MMKKIVTIMAAALLTLGAAANAMAYFANGDLIQVAYVRGGTNEVATDLGSISNVLGGTTVTLTGSNAPSLSALGATSWDQVYVAYFALNTANKNFFVSGDSNTAGTKNYTSLASTFSNLYVGYQAAGGTTSQTVTLAQTAVHSYNTLFNTNDTSGVSNGYMGGYLTTWTGTEANLAALATGGTVTSTIYEKANAGAFDSASPWSATPLTIANSNGMVVASATPIPPSFLLMGSGLLGMVGIRRKFTA